jgi:hypothetical protein
MSIKSVDQARVVTGYHQHAAGTIDAVAAVKGTGSVVMIQAESVSLRYRADGVDPSATVGVLLAAGECHTLNVGEGNISNIKVIGTAVNAILNVTAFR